MKSSDLARLVVRLSAIEMLLFAAVQGTLFGPFFRAGGIHNFRHLAAPITEDYAAGFLRLACNLLGAVILFGKTDRIVLFLGGRRSDPGNGGQPATGIDAMTSRDLATFFVRITSAWLFLGGLLSATYLLGLYRAYQTVFPLESTHLATAENYFAALVRVALYFVVAVLLGKNADRTITFLLGAKNSADQAVAPA